MTVFAPRLDILPPAQRLLWPEFAKLPRVFVLYGGTAVALHLGHRESEDFDFFTSSPLDRQALHAQFAWLESAETIQDEPSTYSVSADLGHGPIKISLFGGLKIGRVGPVFWTQDFVLPVAAPIDLLAHKLKTILLRAHAKDYRDIAALLRSRVELAAGLAAAEAIFGRGFAPAEAVRALSYFDDIVDGDRLLAADRAQLIAAVECLPSTLPTMALAAPVIGATT